MSPDPRLITELRNLFKGGATPSRLVRLIVARHGSGPQIDRLIRAYFREAFRLPMFRASASLLTMPSQELPFAGVNAGAVHQIVERRAEWDREPSSGVTWMDALQTRGEGVERTAPEQSGEFAALREQLGEPARDYLKRLVWGSQDLHEKVVILSRLVERLQEQVLELERNVDCVSTPCGAN